MSLRSLDIMRGAASTDQMAIWTLDWSLLRAKLPMISWKLSKVIIEVIIVLI